MTNKIRVVHYLNQFFAQIGGDTIALDNANPDSENPGLTPTPARDALNLWIGDIVGAISQVGASRLTTYMS